MNIKEILMNLIKSHRLLLDTFENAIIENPLFNPKQDIYGNKFTPMQNFFRNIKLGESDKVVEE